MKNINDLLIGDFISRASVELRGCTTLLDIGCGEAPYRASYGEVVRRSFALDRQLRPNLRDRFACGDCLQLPVRSASADAVLCTEVLEHLSNPMAGVGEIARVL